MHDNGPNNSRDDLPRISVDTFQDLARIRESLDEVAIAALEAKLAGRGMSHHREAFLQHIRHFLHQSFAKANSNLRVNGRNFDEYDEGEQDTEQFDEALDRKVWSLSDQRLKWDLEIAKKRRGIPMEVEALMADLLSKQKEHSLSKGAEENQDMEEDDPIEGLSGELNPELMEVALRTQKSVPEQLERTKRVKEIDEELRGLH